MPRQGRRPPQQPLQLQARNNFLLLHWRLGLYATEVGPTVAARVFGVSRAVAKYWKQRVLDPTYHSDTWGGARYLN